MEHHQVIIIGGGPGGYEAAIRLNQYKIECALIEKERLGGTCLNWGCIPTKALVKSAELWREIEEAESFGLAAKREQLDYTKVFNRKNEIVNKLVSGIEYIFNKRKIPVLRTTALAVTKQEDKFIVNLENGEEISSDFVIIATGSVPKELPSVKIDERDILSSTGILQLTQLPSSLAIIGGGVIGCEFASVFSAFGVEVTIIEFLPILVSLEDEEIAKRLQFYLKKQGIKIKTGTGVTGYTKSEKGISLQLSDGSDFIAEKVLLCVGRTPFCPMEFPSAKPQTERGALVIDETMQTSVDKLYAIGDVTGKLPLAHTAGKQGLTAAAHIRSRLQNTAFAEQKLVYENIPRCTFTNPEVGSCGLTESQAKEIHGEIKVGKFMFNANGKALAGGHSDGFVKIIARADNLQLIGMHILGPNAAELIAEGSILINLHTRAEEAASIVFAHPTLSEAILEAAEDLEGLSLHKM